jgi:hypothetical protein
MRVLLMLLQLSQCGRAAHSDVGYTPSVAVATVTHGAPSDVCHAHVDVGMHGHCTAQEQCLMLMLVAATYGRYDADTAGSIQQAGEVCLHKV